MRRSSLGVAEKTIAAAIMVCGLSAGAASADVLGHRWAEVDNSLLADGSASGLDDGTFNGTVWRTFDLFLEVDTPVVVLDSGFSPTVSPNAGLNLGGGAQYFQFAPFGANNFAPTPAAVNVFPLLEFDSYVGMGELPGSQISLIGFTFDSMTLEGTWNAQAGFAAAPNLDGEIFAGRFTVSSSAGFGTDESDMFSLAGELLVAFNDESNEVIAISNAFGTAIPGPGGLAAFGVAGLAGVWRGRRR